MIYKGEEMAVVQNSINITPRLVKDIRHYPYTNRAVEITKGREPTLITLTAVAFDEGEKHDVEEALNSPGSGTLELGDREFKRVVTQGETRGEPASISTGKVWRFDVTFEALDPFPYDLETGDRIWD